MQSRPVRAFQDQPATGGAHPQTRSRPPRVAGSQGMTSAGFLGLLAATFLSTSARCVADVSTHFEAANKLSEQGKLAAAPTAYEQLIPSAPQAQALYFNLGDAWFKAGQLGRAIVAWRQAAELAPRDPALRFNLQFVRKKVSG